MIRQRSLFGLLRLLSSVVVLNLACSSRSPKSDNLAALGGSASQVTANAGNAGDSGQISAATGGEPSAAGAQDTAGSGGASTGSGGAVAAAGTVAQGGMTADAGPIDNGSAVLDGPTAQAWNFRTGILNADYGSYLSKQDIVYHQPNTNPLYGLPVGNGRVGAMVWSENGLTMQVGGVDLAEQSTFAAGLVNIQTTPALNEASFEQRLQLYNGTLISRYGSGTVVSVMGAPNSETLGLHVEDPRTDVTSVTVELSLWDVSALSNAAAAPDVNTWKTVTSFAETTAGGLSRGQTDAHNFGYTLGATVEGAAFTTQAVSNDRVRITITPSPSYTIWLTASSRLNASGNDSLTAAHKALSDASSAGYTSVLNDYQAFWHDFWGKSFVQFSDPSGDADYLENFYYLSTYVIAAGGFGNYPFHFINGVFRATHDDTKWSNAYWYWNQRDVYHSFLASNHADLVTVFNNLYSRNANRLRSDTMTRYGVQGIWVPETMGFDGNADGTVGSDYTKGILSTGAEAALNIYDQYRYTGDDAYLQNTAYPFIRDVANFYLSRFTHDNATDSYFMGNSNSHETYWQVKNAITDLASVRRLFPIAVAASQKLGLDVSARAQWQDLLDKVVPYPNDGTVYLPHEPPIAQTRNDENVACELIWPYGVTGLGAPDQAMAVATWQARPFPYGNVWANDAIQAARLGLGDKAFDGMKTMIDRYQNYPNGFTTNTNGVFEYWGVHLTALNESLLQSYDEKIRVFPALPAVTDLLTRFTLLAKGGFLISSEKEGGEIKYVGIRSLRGGFITLVNPWPTEAVQVRNPADNSMVLNGTLGELTFTTEAQTSYVVERVSKPLTGFDYGHIASNLGGDGANHTVKHLSGAASTLGL